MTHRTPIERNDPFTPAKPTTEQTATEPERPRDGNGRFLAKREQPSMIPAMSAGLSEALIDADAEVARVETALRTNAALVAAVEFGDRVDHGEVGS